ncbi:uncharacterized protein MONBRDRAFT_37132 [Monosiga brevicollis MX1]|uniref:Uncharacterized protein n=1 Tax=Monosiga brevicollis TaxID=81824 RepID=A9UZT0_MONBE|nr:uncharacterized protein MONBRDRAFT_37132 [Monosiga brevicollis MX1]EDQ89420.1 predicted protein [Monosiga brevicollis MX1]|eukprot:XP_001745996.1 hypothetical protein [Monosiga brevicollis MX1]
MALRATPPPSSGNLTEHVYQTSAPDEAFTSTSKSTFRGTAERRPDARPTSNTRHNNPQSKSFKSQMLPSGEVINVSVRTDVDGHGGVALGAAGASEPASSFDMDSTFRSSFKKPTVEPWQQSTTSRFGMSQQPWASTHRRAVGIVPSANPTQLDATATTTTTNTDAYATGTQFHSRFSATSSRRAPTSVDEEALEVLRSVVKEDAMPAVESWLRSAPGFEGEVVKRMMTSVSRAVTPASVDSGLADPFPASGDRAATPDMAAVSKWGGPVSNIV